MQSKDEMLGELLSGNRIYSIPRYQRPYKWDEDKWEYFFDDFVQTHEKLMDIKRPPMTGDDWNRISSSRHFMGSIVVNKYEVETKRLEIVDGQQRIVTVSLFVAAVLNAWATTNNQFLIGYNASLVPIKTMLNHTVSPNGTRGGKEDLDNRLRPTKNDIPRYMRVTNHAFEITPIAKFENELENENRDGDHLGKAYVWFSKRLTSYLDKVNDLSSEERELFMDTFFETLLNGFAFSVVTVEPNESPQEIFESLNARSEPLTSFDLIKNMFIMQTDKAGKPELDLVGKLEYFDDNRDFEKDSVEKVFWAKARSSSFDKAKGVMNEERNIFANYWLHGTLASSQFEKMSNDTFKSRFNADKMLTSLDGVFHGFKFMMDGRSPEDFYAVGCKMKEDAEFYKKITEVVRPKSPDDVENTNEKLANFFTHNSPLLKGRGHYVSFVYRSVEKMQRNGLWRLIFWLMKSRGENITITEEEEIRFLNILDSFTVRQFLAVSRVPTENLNTTYKTIIQDLSLAENRRVKDWKASGSKEKLELPVGEMLYKIFEVRQDSKRDPSKVELSYFDYPTDAELQIKTPRVRFGSTKQVAIIRTILEEVESSLRGLKDPLNSTSGDTNRKGESKRCTPSFYELEHLMPKQWEEFWDPGNHVKNDVDKRIVRNRAVHELGNFALVNGVLNTKMSNKPWTEKVAQIRSSFDSSEAREFGGEKHQIAILKKIIGDDDPNGNKAKSEWNEKEISNRTQELLAEIFKIWKPLEAYKNPYKKPDKKV